MHIACIHLHPLHQQRRANTLYLSLQTCLCLSKWCLLQNIIFISSSKSLSNTSMILTQRLSNICHSSTMPLFLLSSTFAPNFDLFFIGFLLPSFPFCVVQLLSTMECGQHSKGNTEESWHSFSQKLSTANNFSASGWISYILLLHDEFRSGLSFPMAVHAVSAVVSSSV